MARQPMKQRHRMMPGQPVLGRSAIVSIRLAAVLSSSGRVRDAAAITTDTVCVANPRSIFRVEQDWLGRGSADTRLFDLNGKRKF